MPITVSFPITWTATMVRASHWVGLTLPGMMEEPGSFSGMEISPNPHRGPEASQRTSLASLHQVGGQGLQGPVGKDQGVLGGEGVELVGGGAEGQAGALGHLLGSRCVKPRRGVEPRAHGSAAQGQLVEAVQGRQ